jgi:hypothetical protein
MGLGKNSLQGETIMNPANQVCLLSSIDSARRMVMKLDGLSCATLRRFLRTSIAYLGVAGANREQRMLQVMQSDRRASHDWQAMKDRQESA